MTIDEIFSELAQHMIEGLMTHSQLADYFGFLGLDGYEMCHNYHYFCENANYKKIVNYYIHHYDKLILDKPFKNPGVIPDNWYNFSRRDVENGIRKNATQMGIEKWVNWETITKRKYEKLYQELINLNEVAAAIELKRYIVDVDEELAKAIQKMTELTASDYDMSDIIMEQKELKKKYKKKMREVELC